MFNYPAMRKRAKTGDVLLVKGRGIVSQIIRAVTGATYSHVGMLLWVGDNLFISEFKEFKGYRLIPASLWFLDNRDAGSYVYYGRAPDKVVARGEEIAEAAFKYRQQPYGYLSLLKVWASQITGALVQVRRLVCSTYIQAMWSVADYAIEVTASPSTISDECLYISRIH